jgi:excisionase family DNA binding protein
MTAPPPRAASPDAADASRFCSTTEAARLLGLSNTTVQAMVERGELKAWKTRGGHRRILLESVEQLARLRSGHAASQGRGEARPALVVLLAAGDEGLRAACVRAIDGWSLPLRLSVAGDALEAVLLAERLRPDVLLADLRLEPVDGLVLLRMLRRRPEFDAMAAVAFTELDAAALEARGGVPRGTLVCGTPLPLEKLHGFLEAAALRKELG